MVDPSEIRAKVEKLNLESNRGNMAEGAKTNNSKVRYG